MTRCKVNDIAWISNPESSEYGKFVRILRVATPSDVAEWEPAAWYVEALGSPIGTITQTGDVVLMQRRAIRDRELTPIRPGRPDEVDEMVKLLGVPGEVKPELVGQGEAA